MSPLFLQTVSRHDNQTGAEEGVELQVLKGPVLIPPNSRCTAHELYCTYTMPGPTSTALHLHNCTHFEDKTVTASASPPALPPGHPPGLAEDYAEIVDEEGDYSSPAR